MNMHTFSFARQVIDLETSNRFVPDNFTKMIAVCYLSFLLFPDPRPGFLNDIPIA